MKSQFATFIIASLLITAFVLSYSSKVVAGLDLSDPILVDRPGLKIVLGPKNTANLTATPEEYILEAQQVVAQRLDQLQPSGRFEVSVDHDQLEVTLPYRGNIAHTINLLTQPGEIEFINGGVETPPIGRQVKTGPEMVVEERIYQVLFTGRDITAVIPPDSGQIFYQLTLQPAVALPVADFIENQAGEYICLVIDKQLITCSTMYHWSGDTLDILPNLGGDVEMSLADLAVFLSSGPLPVSLEVVTE